jgi:hypothetical protein
MPESSLALCLSQDPVSFVVRSIDPVLDSIAVPDLGLVLINALRVARLFLSLAHHLRILLAVMLGAESILNGSTTVQAGIVVFTAFESLSGRLVNSFELTSIDRVVWELQTVDIEKA